VIAAGANLTGVSIVWVFVCRLNKLSGLKAVMVKWLISIVVKIILVPPYVNHVIDNVEPTKHPVPEGPPD
jgi:hypothetical protein